MWTCFFLWMQRTRAQFKLSLCYCRQNEDMIRADSAASSLLSKDCGKFWACIKKINNHNTTHNVNVIEGCTDDQEIADKWRSCYERLYNSNTDLDSQSLFFDRLSEVSSADAVFGITVHDLLNVLSKQKCGNVSMVFQWKH